MGIRTRTSGIMVPAFVAPATVTVQNPLQIFGTNLAGWWRADTGVTLFGSSNVNTVADQSGNGNALTSFNEVPYDATGFNGKPTFSFKSSLSANLATNVGVVPISSFGAFFFVGQRVATGAFAGAVVYGAGGGNDFNGPNSAAALTTDTVGNALETRGDQIFASPGIDNSPFAGSTNLRVGVVFNSGAVTQYINNVAQTNVGAAPTNIFATGCVVVGNRYTTGPITTNPWDGPISEIVVINSDATSGLTALDNWFKFNWGL